MLRIITQKTVPTVQAARCLATVGPKPFGKQDEVPTSSADEISFGSQMDMIQGIQGRDVEFTTSRARTVLAGAIEQASMSSAERMDNVRQGIQDTPNLANNQQFDRTGNVSLYSCMQTNVPHPYQHQGRGGVTHLNMPGGGEQQQSRYLSNNLQTNLHPKPTSGNGSRGFHTDATLRASGIHVEEPCPQGVQGDDCVQFQLWKSNCVRFQLSDCDEQLQSFQSGRKSLAQIFEEQNAVIHEIVQQHQDESVSQSSTPTHIAEHDESSIQDSQYPALEGHTVHSLLQESQPCLQGIQGDECAQFKEWLHNCNRYGLNNCQEQLQEVTSGRRNLSQIMQEQEELIESIARQYRSQTASAERN